MVSILLLIGQLGVLYHSVDHPFHTHDHSCQVFLQFESTGNGLTSSELQLPTLLTHVQFIPQIINIWLSLPPSIYYARAPPSLL